MLGRVSEGKVGVRVGKVNEVKGRVRENKVELGKVRVVLIKLRVGVRVGEGLRTVREGLRKGLSRANLNLG